MHKHRQSNQTGKYQFMKNTSAETTQSAGLQINQNQKVWKFIVDANSLKLSQLNRVAINDGVNIYTYRLMFRQWDRYASVFSALGMTEENRARVGIVGSASAEVIFAVYALNMVGAEVSIIPPYTVFKRGRLRNTIQEENLTDFIMTDDFATPDLIQDMVTRKYELGLRNVILLHLPVGGSAVPAALAAAQETKYMYLKTWFGSICMDNLLSAYGNSPIDYVSEECSDSAFILHTSGTTNGIGKPVVLSDRAFNAVPVSLSQITNLSAFMSDPTSGLAVDMSAAYGIIDQVHVPLALSGTIAVVPGGILNPQFYKAIPEYQITFLFAVSAAIETWMKMKSVAKFDFSSLRCIVVGGASVSAKDKQRYCEFLRENGCKNFVFLNGYGVSEMGGACIISTPDIEDESIGYLMPGYDLRLGDDENNRFYRLEDAPCEGILYLTSPSCATPMLDDKEIVKLTEIDGKPFVCTNDHVSLDETGKITYLGRARRFFIHEGDRHFEAGKVEIEIARRKGIESCCVVPVFIKITHDNLPMLCVQVLKDEKSPLDTVLNVLREAFITEKTLSADNIPSRILISPELPRNANGKIDLYGITKGDVEGDIYEVKTVSIDDRISDFQLELFVEKKADMIKEVFDGIKADMKDSLPFENLLPNLEKNKMKQNENNNVESAFSQMPNPLNWLNQVAANGAKNAPMTPFPVPQMPMPNFQLMTQMANQLVNQKISQLTAYAYQMSQVAAQMFDQLYTQHTQMVQQAYEQDKQMLKQFDKAAKQKDEKAEDEKSAEKKAEKSAEKAAEKAAEKPAEKKAEKPAEKKADKPAEKKAEKPADKPAEK